MRGTTTYQYYINTTGCSNNNLVKVTGLGVVKDYSYDALQRLQWEKTTVDGRSYTTTYGYDGYSNLTNTTYPSGVVVNNSYDANGGLVSVSGGAAASPTTLFTANSVNGFGQYTGYTLGNGKTTQNTYTNGLPTRFYTPGIQDLNFTFDNSKGNLTSRRDAIRNLTENFTYDGLNRLTGSALNGTVQLSMTYDGTSTSSLGNITTKSDAGNYTYSNSKIYAVAYITNPAGAQTPPANIATTEQQITYTPFLKTATITEGAYQLDYTYEPGYSRIKSVLKQNAAIIETKYYFGNYERQTVGTTSREVHYISAGNGLCAVIARKNGINYIHYVYTDHLGSILTVTDAAGAIVGEQNFDAWGRKRNPANWQYAGVPAVMDWMYRGYTGHEHVEEFGLINMNGRMYDPVQGRMLSPDNYVATPYGTQGYNRYSYALNNPLVITDPDSNFPIIPILVAAGIGALTSGATYTMTAAATGTWNGGSFLKSMTFGAVAGALSGGIAQVGVSLGASAHSLGLNIISNVGSQVGTNLAFGNDITWGMVAGSIIGGFVSHSIGNFSGVNGSDLANIGAELGFNAFKYGVSGAVSGGIGAALDGGDIGQGALNGAMNGAIGGVAISSLNILAMGPAYKPDREYGDFGRNRPVYRKGTFLSRAIFKEGTGVTLGRNLVTHLAKSNGRIAGGGVNISAFNQYLQAHETGHYAQQIGCGFGEMYRSVLSDYFEYGQLASYSTPGTIEYGANMYSLNLLGYYYDIYLRMITK